MALLLLSLVSAWAFAQNGHKLSFQVKGLADTTVNLAHYYGDKQYITDTVLVDHHGKFVFEGDDTLPGGIYMVILPGKKYFELIVTEQKFSMTTDTTDFVNNMKVEGSYQNKVFYEYLRFIKSKEKDVRSLQEEQKALKEADKSTKKVDARLEDISKEVQDYKNNMIKNEPDAFICKVFLASKDVEVPDPPKGETDTLYKYHYYKKHYFDNIDLTDDRLLRTPVFHNKLETYITKLTIQIPDSINKEADYLVERVRGNKEMFKYVVHYITNTYERSKYMGMDAVFVHMALNYYTKDQAFWVQEEQLMRIRERAQVLSRLLIGKVAPNIVLKDMDGNFQILHQVDADYIVLFFWDPDCGHCKKATPKLKDLYDRVKNHGVKIFAVCTETEETKWVNFIKDHHLEEWINVADLDAQNPFRSIYDITATPKIFLLNRKKEIIAKQLDVEQLEDFLKKELKEEF